jgi:PqqD family protein of HPr-rel-A system
MAGQTAFPGEMLRLNPGLASRELDGDIVAYDETAGNTFLVSGMAARIFAALRGGPIARDELAARFCRDGTGDRETDAAEVFKASLGFLEELEAVLHGASD